MYAARWVCTDVYSLSDLIRSLELSACLSYSSPGYICFFKMYLRLKARLCDTLTFVCIAVAARLSYQLA